MPRTGKHTYAAPATPAASGRRLEPRDVPQDDDAGFTMIEAIVSLTIFVIITVAAVAAMTTGIKSADASRDRVTGANVAQQVLAEAQATPLASLRPSPAPSTRTTSVGSRPYTVAQQVVVEASPALATPTTTCPSAIVAGKAYWLHISVRVTWRGGPSGGVSMDTVRAC